ncbi:MAG: FAD/NAD(P)-binding protein [Nibricoccus sp.]
MSSLSSLFNDVVIVGGGLSGSLLAAQLLRQADAPLRVALIERAAVAGRGVAYGTEESAHLLNVPAGKVSALPDDPDHFFRWVEARLGRTGFPRTVTRGDFLPRQLYGEYVYTILKEARESARPDVRLDVVVGEAIDIEETTAGAKVRLADERCIETARVVLALGNLPGEYPIRRSLRFYHGPRYVHIPWKTDALERIRPNDDILIVGAGLTAIDIILQLEGMGHRGKIHALSRRGLKPQAHAVAGEVYPPFLRPEALPKTVSGALHAVRDEIRRAGKQGKDWRAVLDSIRPVTNAIWAEFSWEQRARFMRHLRPYWEIHRHRLAPQVAAKIEALCAAGRVEFYAGRLESLVETTDGAEAVFRKRGGEERVTLKVGKVINCTGPRSDYSKYQHPLLINLLARGLIDHDPLALGLHANAAGEVFRYRGGPVGWLFTLGAPLKGVLWESTAVPEIRSQARALAEKLISLKTHDQAEPIPAIGR